ncbi:hypothetical protein CCACVL1_19515 [Corchorus capsularis]|uniref:Uncharacterized protein n=1 Tax=Corchorus capsularis TaxID=210143 RepID=A0A1R3HGC7_COCAP|nr:hypothetical protein CCACVL1_19515 [Corchorus capsularis]
MEKNNDAVVIDLNAPAAHGFDLNKLLEKEEEPEEEAFEACVLNLNKFLEEEEEAFEDQEMQKELRKLLHIYLQKFY